MQDINCTHISNLMIIISLKSIKISNCFYHHLPTTCTCSSPETIFVFSYQHTVLNRHAATSQFYISQITMHLCSRTSEAIFITFLRATNSKTDWQAQYFLF